jgi:iron(III) transport system substrate-binding protein
VDPDGGFSLKQLVVLTALVLSVLGCTKKSNKPEVWVYTSIYKDTVNDIQPMLEKAFPDVKVNFFQAGSEEVAAKINAEELSGGTKADIVIFSDRFWFEDMAAKNRFVKYAPKGSEQVADAYKNKDGMYAAICFPVMVLIYNSDAVAEKDAPKTFKEMADPKWKGKFATGSPLESGTNFTTVAFLQKLYGWDYFKKLRANDTISNGGNSAVMRRVQTKERPVGWVLLENYLRVQDTDPKIKVVYPEDGAVLQTNNLAVIKKDAPRENAQKVADWFFSGDGQAAMVKAFMYAAVPGQQAPRGGIPFADLMAKAQKWTPELVQEFAKNRESIKEEFAKVMLQ